MTAEPIDSPAALTMTLAAIAATGAASRPSGESLSEQRRRIAAGITRLLSDPALAIRGSWELMWLGLSPYNANMAYIARSTIDPNLLAVVVRGTNANVTDILEDLDVGTVVPFTTGGSSKPLSVSKGAMTAFSEIVSMIDAPSPTGAGLVQTLADLLAGASSQPALYVIGHSLGGCIATMLALHLHARPWGGRTPQVGVVTFAAPTAGLKDFADHFNSVRWTVNLHYVNDYDMVPRAWADLDAVKQWYPADHGPVAPADVRDVLIPEIEALTGPNVYVQPKNTEGLNSRYGHYDHDLVKSSTGDFLGQAAHQHANSTYLKLLRARVLPAGPVVTTLDPATGEEGTTVTINGTGFAADPTVYFGNNTAGSVTLVSPTRITATAPPSGTSRSRVVDVRVLVNGYLSSSGPAGEFTYTG